MILFWRIRYLDTTNREFRDRDLWLDTDELSPLTKAAVEACNEMKRPGSGRAILAYRRLFKPKISSDEMHRRVEQSGRFASVYISEYFEDQDENELTNQQMAVALTGNESAVHVPSGAKQHDIDFMFAEKRPIEIDKISLSPAQLKVLGYFSRDLREMRSSTFFKEGAGTLSGSSGSPLTVQTAVNDEEIRSFVTIFRRLYMQNEPANLAKAADVFASALAGHPIANWVTAAAADIAAGLEQPPDFMPLRGKGTPTFTVKRLVDVFLYTQYAHQPDERRSRQFDECLRNVLNDRAVLTYLFLSELWLIAIQMVNVGERIAHLFRVYCEHHHVVCEVVPSPSEAHPGIGALEKKQQREDRILAEKAVQVAIAMWHEAGDPPAGPEQFNAVAAAQLREAIQSNGA